MKKLTRRLMAGAALLTLSLGIATAQQDSALLDVLVKKGVLTDQEAEDVRAQSAQEYSQSSAGKLSLSSHVTQLKLYGDARLRYEYLDEQPQAPNGSPNNTVERYRYRLRIGADYTFTDRFSAGFELETANADDSANQSLGNGFGKFSANIGLIYLQWKPTDWLTLVGGKQRNPLYTTDLVWDADVNPEGGAEIASFNFPIEFGGSSEPAPAGSGDPKDAKSLRAPAESSSTTWNLSVGFTAGQFIYADNNEYNAATTDHTDVWMFVEQVPIQLNFNKNTFVKVVPGFTSYLDGGTGGIPGSFTNGSAGSTSWTGGGALAFSGPNIADHLQIFTAPGEFDFAVGDLPLRVYWDFALNTDAKARIQDVYFGNGVPGVAATAAQAENRSLGDNIAWLAGVQVGQNKKKGDWSVKADFRQVGLGATDPNINDSDWADSFLNQQGVKVQAIYNFTDFLTGSIAFYDTWNLKSGLLDGSSAGQTAAGLPLANTAPYGVGSPGTNIANLAGANATQRVQVDLLWKF